MRFMVQKKGISCRNLFLGLKFTCNNIVVDNRLVKLLGGAILATAATGSKQSRHYRSYQCNESVGSCDLIVSLLLY